MSATSAPSIKILPDLRHPLLGAFSMNGKSLFACLLYVCSRFARAVLSSVSGSSLFSSFFPPPLVSLQSQCFSESCSAKVLSDDFSRSFSKVLEFKTSLILVYRLGCGTRSLHRLQFLREWCDILLDPSNAFLRT